MIRKQIPAGAHREAPQELGRRGTNRDQSGASVPVFPNLHNLPTGPSIASPMPMSQLHAIFSLVHDVVSSGGRSSAAADQADH